MNMKWRLIFFLVLINFFTLSPTHISTLSFSNDSLHLSTLPSSASPIVSPMICDLDRDGINEELILDNYRLNIVTPGSSSSLRWQSPIGWRVLQVNFTDLNKDQHCEATLLLWRSFEPWPVDRFLAHGGRIQSFHDVNGQSCHIILIGWKKGAFRELWAGSALANPVITFSAADVNQDGDEELLTLESTYQAYSNNLAGWFKVLEWNGFGFSLLDEYPGDFSKFQLVTTPQLAVQYGGNNGIESKKTDRIDPQHPHNNVFILLDSF